MASDKKDKSNESSKDTKDTKGITVKKAEDFSEWYTQVIQKAELIEYSPVSGCYILRPNSYQIWEKAQAYFDKLIKADGVKNAYFPLFIPESLLQKEAAHVEGFAPEVAWVTHTGGTKLKERLAVRPTSETIMYDSYAKWIRSHQDLPLRINQWCNIVRWEFKHPMPFIRSREFLWQEGHTVFATQEEAIEETHTILDFYEKVFNEIYAIPMLKGRKSDSEKFAGADFTLSVETVLPNGKGAQGATSHHLGQNFSKPFDISFIDKNQEKSYGWQNSWGFSTRSIGLMILIHGDDKGLVLPPKVAPTQVVVVPILFDESKKEVLVMAERVYENLSKDFSVHLDAREDYSPGWKFNEWEVKGIPLRIEIGPRDLEKNQVTLVRRDTGEKQGIEITEVENTTKKVLEQIQQSMFSKAEKLLQGSIVEVQDLNQARSALGNKKIIFAPWCDTIECEANFKDQTGAKSLNSPFRQPKIEGKCFACEKEARKWFYFGKSY